MGIYSRIKLFFYKKKLIKKQSDHSIPNLINYNLSIKTIVFINGGIPTYDKDSGSNRLKEIILTYKKIGYNCIICTNNAYRENSYVKYFIEKGIIVYVETNQFKNYFEFLKTIAKVNFIWYYSPNSFKNNYTALTKIFPKAKSIYDMVDIHFLRYERAIEIEPFRISLKKKYKKYFDIETNLVKKADYIITISDFEKEIMKKYIDINKLITISNIHYPKIKINQTLPFEDRNDLLFIGSTHSPNIDALYFLFKEIMPIVWREIPNLKVNIIGNINDVIKDIIDPNFIFLGYVPDIEDFFISNKIMIAPLRYGAGVKGKIGQALEYYLPVITTSIGAEGMNLTDNKNAIIRDNPLDFANSIIDLYQNKKLWLTLKNNSENSLESFSIENLISKINLIN